MRPYEKSSMRLVVTRRGRTLLITLLQHHQQANEGVKGGLLSLLSVPGVTIAGTGCFLLFLLLGSIIFPHINFTEVAPFLANPILENRYRNKNPTMKSVHRQSNDLFICIWGGSWKAVS
ncbi:hypothetical protein Q3G72_035066 [Acer saccharum]|nr:hypothetical protein Q3G72_035066 [Acer saccharum]